MSSELGDWLAELRASDLAAATSVGAALLAVMDADDLPGLAAVSQLAVPPAVDPADLVAAVEDASQAVRSALGLLRQQVAAAASYRHSTRQRITPHGSYPHPLTTEELAEAERREQELIDRMQTCQLAAESFRLKTIAATARHTSAAAMRDIQLTLLAAGGQTPAEQAAAHDDLSEAEASAASAEAELAGLLPEATALRRSFIRASAGRDTTSGDTPGSDTADPGDIEPGLLELHADPLGTDARILFAIEPADTVTLLAVLDGSAAVSEHRYLAIKLAGELLAELRTAGWPQDETDTDGPGSGNGAELTFADPDAFLATYFADSRAEVGRQSVALEAASTLQRLRHEQQLSLTDLAGRTGLKASELWRLETGELTGADVADVAAYVRALGGRLRMIAESDGEQQILI
jgi:hypothetical protein